MNTVVKTFKIFSLAAVAAILSIGTAAAQSDQEISDEKITAYIIVMDSVDALGSKIQEDIGNMIKDHELLDGGRAYQTISSAKGDSVKLAEEGITEEQIAAYNEIMQEMETRKNELNEIFVTLVKEKVGAAEYNQIKKGLRSDPELKERYDAIAAEIEEEKTAEGENAEPANENSETVN